VVRERAVLLMGVSFKFIFGPFSVSLAFLTCSVLVVFPFFCLDFLNWISLGFRSGICVGTYLLMVLVCINCSQGWVGGRLD